MSFFGKKLPPAGRWLLFFATSLLLLLLLTALFFAWPPDNGTGSKRETTVEPLEHQIEIKRHEQLEAIKNRPGNILAAFTTDGCSGGLSVGWEYLAGMIKEFHAAHGTRPPWESCCITHDRKYHTGGVREITAEESFQARREADNDLRNCILQSGKERTSELRREHSIPDKEVETIYTGIADLMYRAVRIGGMPCTGLPWRWGYGWPECE